MPAVLRPVLAVLTVVAAPGALSCQSSDPSAGPTGAPTPTTPPVRTALPTQAQLPMRVVVTLPVFAEFAREMGGDNVEVVSLVPADADPSTYQPTAEDVAAVAGAHLVFINNREPGVESAALLDAIETNRGENTKVIPFMPNIRSPRADEFGDPDITAAEVGDNPYLWLDPVLARVYANILADSYVIEDGINGGLYNGNLTTYGRQLFGLSSEIQTAIAELPQESRDGASLGAMFTHFARRYGLQVAQSDADAACNLRIQPGGELATYMELMRFNAEETVRCLSEGATP